MHRLARSVREEVEEAEQVENEEDYMVGINFEEEEVEAQWRWI